MNLRNFFAELKRRNVYKVAVAYSVVGWLVIQIATQVFPFFAIPNWTIRTVVVLLLLGFPLAVFLAWAYELTPDGIKRSDDITPTQSISRATGRKWDFVIIGILLVIIAVFGFQRYWAVEQSATQEGAKISSVAVLPLKNLMGDANDEYLVDGLTDGLISSISKIPGLKVISRGSAFALKGQEIDPSDVGKRLQVMSVLEGSVRKNKDAAHVSVRLVSTENSGVLWTESADRPLDDLITIEDELARGLSAAIGVELRARGATALPQAHTPISQAYQLYLKGRYFWNKRTAEDLKKSVDYFDQAIARDANYALAYAGLADSYALFNYYGASPPNESFPRARLAAERALQIDDTLPEAHASLAYIKRAYDWDWAGAEREFRRAVALNPNYATAHFWYGEHLTYLGRFDEGIKEMQRAEELDPLSTIICASVGWGLYMARQPERAIEQLRRALELDQSFAMTHFYLGMAYEGKGLYEQAIGEHQKAAELSPTGPGITGLGHAYAVAGMRKEAQQVLNELKARVDRRQARPGAVAIVYAGLNDNDHVFEWMERSYEQRLESVVYLKAHPYFDNLRSDPRRAAFLQRLGLD